MNQWNLCKTEESRSFGFVVYCPTGSGVLMTGLSGYPSGQMIVHNPDPQASRAFFKEEDVAPLEKGPEWELKQESPIQQGDGRIVSSRIDKIDSDKDGTSVAKADHQGRQEKEEPQSGTEKCLSQSSSYREVYASNTSPTASQIELSSKSEVFTLLEMAKNGKIECLPEDQSLVWYRKFLEEAIKQQVRPNGRRSAKSQPTSSHKNVTQHYLTILEYATVFLQNESVQVSCLPQIKFLLESSVNSIAKITSILIQPSFRPFLLPLKNGLFTQKILSRLVMTLPADNNDKLMMLRLLPHFLHAIQHPSMQYGWEDLLREQTEQKCKEIAASIKQGAIDWEEAVTAFRQVQRQSLENDQQLKNKSRFNNISRMYHGVIRQATTELIQKGAFDDYELKRLAQIGSKKDRSISVRDLKQMMKIKTLRIYLMTEYIQRNRVLVQMLLDSSVKCRRKLMMMECYPNFVELVENPQLFTTWNED